jgi:hypothetical protein
MTLARGASRNILALGALLTAGDVDARPCPVGAAARSTKDVNISGRALHGTSDLLEGNIRNLDAVGGIAGGAAVLVVLLDDNTVLGDTLEGDVLEPDAGDGASRAVDGLDARAVLRVDDLGVGDGDVVDGVVFATADGADGETMATVAVAVGEDDVLAGVDSQAVVLVVDGGAVDGDVGAGADVKGIGVVAQLGTGGVIDQHVLDGEVVGLDAEALDGGVVDLQTDDVGLVQLVGGEELGLLLAAVASLAVPPTSTSAVNLGTGVLLDGDAGTGHGDQGAGPFFVTEGGGAIEDDSGTGLQASQVESLTGGNGDVAQGDGGAGGLAGLDRGRRGEGARATSLEISGGSSSDQRSAHGRSHEGGLEEMHGERAEAVDGKCQKDCRRFWSTDPNGGRYKRMRKKKERDGDKKAASW